MMQWGFYFDQTRCINCKTCVLACKAWNHERRGDSSIHPFFTWEKDDRYNEPSDYENLPGSDGGINYSEFNKYCMKENWRRVESFEYGVKPPEVYTINLSISCNHCDNPACVEICPTKYIYKEEKYGIVTIDESKICLSCGACKKACPWDSPQFYDDIGLYKKNDPNTPKMTKCDLCIDRLEEGLKPACVTACIVRALDAGPIDELKSRYPKYSEEALGFKRESFTKSGLRIGPNIIFKKR